MQQNSVASSPMRARRVRLGLTLRELAARCAEEGAPVDSSQLSQIERGRTKNPRPRTRAALAKILSLDPLEIGGMSDEPRRPTTATAAVGLRSVRDEERTDPRDVQEVRG